MPTRSARSRKVNSVRPFSCASSQAAPRISARVASRRSATLSRLGTTNTIRRMRLELGSCQEDYTPLLTYPGTGPCSASTVYRQRERIGLVSGFSRVADRSRGRVADGRNRGGNHRKWRWSLVSGVIPGAPRGPDLASAGQHGQSGRWGGDRPGLGSQLPARARKVSGCAYASGSIRCAGNSHPGVFARVVPFLVAGGSLLLAVQPALMKLHERRDRRRALLRLALIGAVSVYGGYIAAGAGVMLLAVILILVDSGIPRANAIKNVLLGVISLVAATVFIARGPVLWGAVLPLSGGLLIGSALGPVITRQLPQSLVRWIASAFGFTLAIYLWLRPA